MRTETVLAKLRRYLADYISIADESIFRVIALWIAGTYIYEAFDAFPYMAITARVKRAGKTRMSELIGFTCSMPFNVAGASAAALFRIVQDNKPTIIQDEAEKLSSESASVMRQFLNVGYRKGQTIPRATGSGVVQWPTFCPKVFVLIGDVYDTLRDRSIIVEMQRGEPKRRFSYETAKAEGFEIAEELKSTLSERIPDIIAAYEKADASFLTDRDAEIWRAIFAIANVLEPENVRELSRTAVDMATEKTQETKRYGYVNQQEAEKQIEREEYARRALKDLEFVMQFNGRRAKKDTFISSVDAVDEMKNIDVAPWRKYQGTGLDMNILADLLGILELRPKPCRVGDKVFRGYSAKDIAASAKKYKIQP